MNTVENAPKATLKKVEWVTSNRMKFESLHKEFNRQTNIISTGNIIAKTIIGIYIRSWYNAGDGLIDYPENKRANGVLFKYDIKFFEDNSIIIPPNWLIRKIEEESKKSTESNIFYCLFHRNNLREIVTHGYILTKGHKDNYKLICTFNTNRNNKSYSIINEALKYLATY